jgi:hypothetical protein
MGQARKFNLFDNTARFVFVVRVGTQNNFASLSFAGPKLLWPPARIVFDDGIGGVENGTGRAIILFQFDDFDLGKVLFEVEQVADFRAAPAVNALVIVADDAKVPVLFSQRVDELELSRVGVLVLVRHDVAILIAAAFQGIRMFGEKPERKQNQIIEVHGVARMQRRLVSGSDVLGERPDACIGKGSCLFTAVFESAQQTQDRGGICLFAFCGNLRQDFFDDAQLFRFVVDDEIVLIPEFFDMPAEDADAERMKRADGRAQFGSGPAASGLLARGGN